MFVDLPAPHPSLPGLPARPVAARDRDVVAYRGAVNSVPTDSRTPAQRMASFAIAASGIVAAVLFFALRLPWYIFLLPAVIGVLTSAALGGDGNRRR